MTGRTVWFNCFAGIAGDMLLGVARRCGSRRGRDRRRARRARRRRVRARRSSASSAAVSARRGRTSTVDDPVDDDHGVARHDHRPARDVLELIGAADLPDRVRDRAQAVYRALAEVEGEIHGIDADDVELHEVGALDSIVDVVGVCVALEVLGIDDDRLQPDRGRSRHRSHGRTASCPTRPRRSPRCSPGAGAPTVGIDTTMETATPTGVALMTVLAGRFGALPAMTVTCQRFRRRHRRPVRSTQRRPSRHRRRRRPMSMLAGTGRPARLVEANVDDVTGEVLAHTIAGLLAAGAYDAWATPIVMKKGRPAHTVHALCDDATFAAGQRRDDRRDRHPRRACDDRRSLAAASRGTLRSTSVVTSSASR